MSFGLSRQSSKTGATLTKMGEGRVIEDVFLNRAMEKYLDRRHVKNFKRTLSKIPEKSSLLPRLRRGEDQSFLMPREDFGYAKKKRKGKKGKKRKKRSSKAVSTIKRAARNSLKKAQNILSNSKRIKRRNNKRTGRKKN